MRVWDKDGTPTDWSKAARFSVGLLARTDWEGDRIRFKEADEVKHIWYRKNFTLDEVPSLAFTYLASIGYHELFVNGELIDARNHIADWNQATHDDSNWADATTYENSIILSAEMQDPTAK